MARCEMRVEIEAPVSYVWSFTQDPKQRYRWDYRVSQVRLLNRSAPEKGARFRTEGNMLGTFQLDMEYVTFEPFQRSAVKLLDAKGIPFAHGGGTWRYEVLGEYRSSFHTTLQMHPAPSLYAKWFDKLLLEPMLGWMTNRSLQKLKAVIEADYHRWSGTK